MCCLLLCVGARGRWWNDPRRVGIDLVGSEGSDVAVFSEVDYKLGSAFSGMLQSASGCLLSIRVQTWHPHSMSVTLGANYPVCMT